jgi:hypothetical protein
MKNLFYGAGSAACALIPGIAIAGSASFSVSATTQPAVSVNCSEDLRFGTISVEPNNSEVTITVDATSNASATSSGSDVYPAPSVSGPAACTITNASGSGATAQLSAAGTSASGATLSDVKLMNGDNALSANIELGKASGIGNETLYVGGTLNIPANHVNFGNYSETITLTVTE